MPYTNRPFALPPGMLLLRVVYLTLFCLYRIAEELERERDEAKRAMSGFEDAYEETKDLYLRECAEHERTERWVGRLARAVAVLALLLVISVFVVWRLLA